MYGTKAASRPQKLFLLAAHLLTLAFAWWLLFANGIAQAGHAIGTSWAAGDPLRRALLLAAAAVYFLRLRFTTFVFLKRMMTWSEASTIAVWLLVITLVYAIAGGIVTASIGPLGWAGIALYLVGSAINSGSEYQRMLWKRDPRHHGHLYTEGLFSLSMHVNYFGDLVLFTGWSLIAGNPWTLLVPAAMFAGFAFANIPMLDRYLARRYGAEFTEWQARTARLIPFVW